MRYHYRAVLEDGTVIESRSDQRDIAKFEIQPFGCGFQDVASRPLTFARWTAWHAARRAKATNLSWEAFDAQCVEIETLDDEDEQQGGQVKVVSEDPGNPAASAAS